MISERRFNTGRGHPNTAQCQIDTSASRTCKGMVAQYDYRGTLSMRVRVPNPKSSDLPDLRLTITMSCVEARELAARLTDHAEFLETNPWVKS